MFPLIFLGSFGIDLLTKLIVSRSMELGQEIVLIKPVLSLNYVLNYGAAYNLFEGSSWVLIPVTHKEEFPPLERAAFAMLLGGGAGNLFSRLTAGYVVDFIDIHIIPIFNAADIFICCGCALLLLCEFFPRGAKGGSAEKDGTDERS